MPISNPITPLLQLYRTLAEIARLPEARLVFHAHIDPADINATYRNYTRPHPRYKIIGHKTVGVALLDLASFANADAYLGPLQGKNLGAWHAKRARSRGYVIAAFDRNRHIDDIHAINTSIPERQGRPMDAHYREKTLHFEQLAHFRTIGAFDREGKLAAYATFGIYGNFAAFSQLIGYRNNDGAMHLLVTEIVCKLIAEGQLDYLMYDTFFGAQPGLQQFKRVLGFRPYRARYELL